MLSYVWNLLRPSRISTSFLGAPSPTITSRFVNDASSVVKLGRELGHGRFGIVREAQWQGREVAVKIVPKTFTGRHDLKNEVQCLEKVAAASSATSHNCCMQLLDAFEDRTTVYIVTPLYSGGELFDHIVARRVFTEKDAAIILKDILQAISTCHGNRVVHRDVKPENLLYTSKLPDAHLVLVDFGMSRTFRPGDDMSMQCGSPSYVAPEVLQCSYNEKCDEWSAGIILHILCTGETPFGAGTDDEILAKVEQFNDSQLFAKNDLWKTVSPQARDLAAKLLRTDPNERISASEALQHEWITDVSHEREHVTLDDALRNMREFNRHHQLKKAAIRVISELARNDEKARSFVRMLESLRRNDKGHIQLADIASLIAVPQDLITKEGAVDPNELIASALSRSVYLDEQYLLEAFKRFDLDANGVIDREELTVALKSEGKVDAEIVQAAMQHADTDGSGGITFEEFARVVRESTANEVAKKREHTLRRL